MRRKRPGKKFVVEIRPAAFADMESTLTFIARHDPLAASRYARKLTTALRSLRTMPFRYPLIAELRRRGVRQAVVGSHRILYIVTGTTVTVLRVLHQRERVEKLSAATPAG